MHVRLAILPSTPLDVHVRTTCHDPGTHSMMVTDHPASRLHRVVMFHVKRADDRVYSVQRLGTLLQGMARLARWLLLSGTRDDFGFRPGTVYEAIVLSECRTRQGSIETSS